MNIKEKKLLMTRVAKGEISEKEAQNLINSKKMQPGGSNKEIGALEKHTRKRKSIKLQEVN